MIKTAVIKDSARVFFKFRFIKFGLVGFSGIFVNWLFLYLGHDYLFAAISKEYIRLNLSLAVAIFFATISNFCGNLIWTWRDRHLHIEKTYSFIFVQFGQYVAVCSVAIFLQFLITNLLAGKFHYLLANIIAIVCASIINFLLNDLWTFRFKKKGK